MRPDRRPKLTPLRHLDVPGPLAWDTAREPSEWSAGCIGDPLPNATD
jgi:hypothetical protein